MMSVGTWLYNDSTAEATVIAAVKAGFTHIDTAYDYANQRGVAQGIKKCGVKRGDLFVTTKVPGCGLQNSSAVSVQACQNSTAGRLADDFDQLDLDYIDLVLVHFPPCAGADGSEQEVGKATCTIQKTGCSDPRACDLIRAQWFVLTEAYKNNIVRSIGVSNFCSACFKCLDGVENVTFPMVNQVQFHVGMGPDPQGFKTFAEHHGVKLQAYSPLGAGGSGSDELLHGNLTTTIGKKYNKSSVQVALKWILSHNTSVSTKSSNPEHLAENLDIFDFDLNATELAALDAADFAKQNTPSFLCDDASSDMLNTKIIV